MNTPENCGAGRGRPPEHTRWRTGQCGNPRRIYSKKAKPVATMIDEFFARKIRVSENGKSEIRSAFAIIYLQLVQKAATGHKRALNVWLKYQEFAASRGNTRPFKTKGQQ